MYDILVKDIIHIITLMKALIKFNFNDISICKGI